jgi:prepilin peptidase CpaA
MLWDFVRIGLAFVAGGLLLSAGIEDARTREIADWKSVALCALAPLWWWANAATFWPGAAVQIATAAILFAVFAAAFHFGMMGGGDVKLISALTLWLPLPELVGMLVVMSLVGGGVTVAMLIDRHFARSDRPIEVPYGVAIAAAGILAFREPILNHFA